MQQPSIEEIYSHLDNSRRPMVAYYADEVFKPYPNNPRYLISNYGTVYDQMSQRHVCHHLTKTGYHMVKLAGKDYMVHRLVLQTFAPISNDQEMVVNHLDNHVWNNHWDTDHAQNNLVWCTQKENIHWAINSGHQRLAENAARAIFSNAQVHRICQLMQQGCNFEQIALDLGLPYTPQLVHAFSNIRSGRTYTSISSLYPGINRYTGTNGKKLLPQEVETICAKLAEGKDARQIAAEMDIVYSRVFRTVVNYIKDGSVHSEISSKYSFPKN